MTAAKTLDTEAVINDLMQQAGEKPRLLISNADPDESVDRIRDALSGSGRIFDRAGPVRVAHDQTTGGAVVHRLTPEGVIREVAKVARPFIVKKTGSKITEVDISVPRPLAVSYLDARGEWDLQPLDGIACSPLLHDNGSIHAVEGYDAHTRMWAERVPDLRGVVPDHPTETEAKGALRLLREMFGTFPYADAIMITGSDGVARVALDTDPGQDESGFLHSLMTAVCRASLDLAPALLIRSAALSGSGTGKGLVVRCICAVAHGRLPNADTIGTTAEEIDKRISSELLDTTPAIFLDNVNSRSLKSDVLASAITERPARVRVLGRSELLPLNPSSFIAVTGNGLDVGEDLVRRFIKVELDARTEDPEARVFPGSILEETQARRRELLAACLTVWRWGRHQEAAGQLAYGRPLGSFTRWCRWVRDPLIALGCRDPAMRIAEAKARDSHRNGVKDIFEAWHRHHGTSPVKAKAIHDEVRAKLDPQGRGGNYVTARLQKIIDTRVAGFVFRYQSAAGEWGIGTYALEPVDDEAAGRGAASSDDALMEELQAFASKECQDDLKTLLS